MVFDLFLLIKNMLRAKDFKMQREIDVPFELQKLMHQILTRHFKL